MKNKTFISNIFFLYILMFSTQILNLITIPYQSRVLEPTVYGIINVAMSVMMYIQIILDFGFTLYATKEVAKNKDNNLKLKEIHTNVFKIKILLSIVIILLFIIINAIFNLSSGYLLLYILFMASTIFASLVPDYIYRGLENMKKITVRTVIIKVFFTGMIFILLKEPSDYLLIPILLLLGNLFSYIYSMVNLKNEYNITLIKTNLNDIKKYFRRALPFFASRFSSTFYQALNTIIIGNVYGTSPQVGYYAASDKLINISKAFATPVADGLYPYMVKNKNYKIIKKIMIICMPLIIVAGIVAFIFADEFVIWFFGASYADTAVIFRCMLPIAFVILPSYILSFPVMVPMKLSKEANFANILGAICQVTILIILFVTANINIITIAISAAAIEVIVFIYRLTVVLVNRKKLNRKK